MSSDAELQREYRMVPSDAVLLLCFHYFTSPCLDPVQHASNMVGSATDKKKQRGILCVFAQKETALPVPWRAMWKFLGLAEVKTLEGLHVNNSERLKK